MLLALPLALLLAAGAAAQSLNFGTWAWDRASSSVPVVARTAHAAASDFATLVVSGGATFGGARDGSSTVFAVTGAGGTAARAVSVLPAANNGVAGNLSLTSIESAASALVWDDAAGASPLGDALLAYSGVGENGALWAGLARMSLGAGAAWTALPASGANTARAQAAAVFLPRCNQTAAAAWTGCFAVFGGVVGTGLPSANLLVNYFPGSPAPSVFAGYPFSLAATVGTASSSRFGHTLAAHPDGTSAFLFGGTVAGSVTNDVYWLSASGFSSPLASELVDIALGKAASGTPGPDPIASANFSAITDGIVATTHNPAANAAQKATAGYNQCFQTNSNGTNAPFVMVDLGGPASFAAVQVYTRTDCNTVAGGIAGQLACLSAMQNFQIWAGSAAGAYNALGNTQCTGAAANDFAGGLAYVPCSRTSARYVFIVLPGVLRVLTVCEVQVLKAQPWTWRRLSGSREAASGANSAAATMTSGNAASPGEAFRAIDGFKTNDFRSGSCASTSMSSSSVVAGGFQQWMVDLGTDYTLQSITLWPAVFLDAAGTTDLFPNRTRNWYVYAGYSPTNALLNTLCKGPFSPAIGAGGSSVPCATSGRYVQIRRYSGPAASPMDNDDTVAVCEVSVTVAGLPNLPSARTGHAAAQFRGDMVVFGGIDANSKLLSDVHFFDMFTQTFLQNTPTPLGSAPLGRSRATLTVLGANLLAVAGGSVGSDPTALVDLLTFVPCTAFSPVGVQSVYCTRDKTACQYTCGLGYVSNNPSTNGWVVCKRDGTYWGLPTPCSIVQASAQGVTATPVASPPSVNVGWTKVGTPTHFEVQAVIDPKYEIFDPFPLPTTDVINPLAQDPQWSWYDPTASAGSLNGLNKVFMSKGSLSIGAQPTCDCVAGNSSASANCPIAYITNNPANFDLNNYVVETSVSLDPATNVFSAYTAGIAIIDSVTKLVQFELGLSNDPVTSMPRVEWVSIAAVANQFSVMVDIPRSSGGVFLRIERSATRTLGGWLASWRIFPNDAWTVIGNVATTANFFDPSMPIANLRAGLLVRNSAGASSSVAGFSTVKYADFQYFRLAGLSCATVGRAVVVPATTLAVSLTGLSAGGHYQVAVAGSSDGGITFGAAAPSASFTMPAAIVLPAPVSLIEVAKGKSAFSNPVALGSPAAPASLANDGNANTTFLGASGLPQCFRSNPVSLLAGTTSVVPAGGLRWTVDLGWDTDVHSVRIYNSATRAEFLSGFQVSVSAVADASADITCDMSATPVNLTSAPYTTNVSCGLHGRYVTVSTPTDPYNVANPQDLRLCEVQVFAPNSCPARPAPANGAVTLGCGAGSPYLAECFQKCNAGYKAISGDEYAVCRGGSWDQPPLVCAALCPEILPQSNVDSCTRTLVYDLFQGSASAVQARWTPLDQRQTFGSFWFADGDAGLSPNTLQASARLGCDSNMVIVSENLDVEKLAGEFVAWTSLATSDQAGIAFRVQDIENYYIFGVDVLNLVLFCDVIIKGAATRLAEAPQLDLRANTPYQLTAQVKGTKLFLYFAPVAQLGASCNFGSACEYGTLVFPYIMDDTFLFGGTGLFATSTAVFSWFEVDAGCDSCANLAEGEICTFTCKAGNSYGSSSSARTCKAAYALDNITSFAGFEGTQISCSPKAPIIRSEAITCYEGLALDAPCGAPIDAVLPAPSMEASYTIDSGNVNSAFYISSCSGQLIVANASAFFARINQNFTLLVTVRVTETNGLGGTSTSSASANVTVVLMPLPAAPTMPASQTLTVPENSPAGAPVGVVACTSPSGPAVVSLLSDGAQGRFAVAASGAVRVTASAATLASYPLNFEADPNSWLLTVRCALAADSTKFTTGSVNVTLLDADDAPFVQPSVLVQLNEQSVIASPPGVGLTLTPTLPTFTTDEDTNPAFLAPARPLTYALIDPTLMQAVCTNAALNINVASTQPVVDPRFAPTTTGYFNNGSALFAITAAGGVVSVAAAPAPPTLAWTNALRPPVLYTGFVVLGAYQVCVNVSGGAGTPSRLQVVPVGVVANLATRAVISGCTYPNPMSIAGGESVVCSITNLNSFADVVSATYSNSVTSYAAACSVSAATSSISCTTAPGVGSYMRWTFIDVTFGNAFIAQSSSLVTRYAAPVVNSMTGNAAALTAGGTTITFAGQNLGTAALMNASAVTVSVGASLQYPCAFTPAASSSTLISCVMGPGAGANLPVQVLVSGQAYAPTGTGFTPTVTFAAPSVSCVFVAGANCSVPGTNSLATSGGTTVIIQGSNFGPNTGEAISASFGPTTGLEFLFSSCASVVSSPQTQISCVTAPATGTNLGVVVKVAGQASVRTSGSGSLGVSFAAPLISTVDGPGTVFGSTAGGQTIYIEGSGFGAATLPGTGSITVSYGPPGTGALPFQATNCYVDQAPPTSSGRINCLTAPGTGLMARWQVVIAGGTSLPFVFAASAASVPQYGNPVILSVQYPNPLPAPQGLSTAGSQLVKIQGENFGPIGAYTNSVLQVWFGVQTLTSPTPPSVSLGFSLAPCTVSVAHTQLTCTTPPGTGAGMSVVVYVNGLPSTQPTLSYLAPTISQLSYAGGNLTVAPGDCNTPFQVTISGLNFGPSPYFPFGAPGSASPGLSNASAEIVTSVTYGPTGVEYAASSFQHVSSSSIIATVGANDCGGAGFSVATGRGAPLYFKVVAGNQAGGAALPAFAYNRPQIVSLQLTSAAIGAAGDLTLTARQVPFLDPLNALVILLGNAPSVIALSPNRVTTAAGLSQLLNADGTYNVSAPLPRWFAGAGLAVRLGRQSIATGLVSPITDLPSAPLFSYAGPQIAGVAVSLAPWLLQGNLSLCPFTAFPANPKFSCADPAVHQVIVSGSGFGALDRLQDAGVPASYVDGVARELDVAVAGGNGTTWVAASTSSAQLWFDQSRWSNSRLVAYTTQLLGQVQVKLTTANSAAAPQTSAPVAFGDVTPAIGALSGATTNLPTAGGATATPWAVLTLGFVNRLENALNVAVKVGGRNCPLVVLVGGVPSGPNGTGPLTGGSLQYVTDVNTQVLQPGRAAGSWSLSCVVPPGQGSRATVSVVRSEAAASAEFFSAATVAYAAPVVSSYHVRQPGAPVTPPDCGKYGCGAAALDNGFTPFAAGDVSGLAKGAVLAPCIGGAAMRIRGSNLGAAPVVTLADGYTISGAALYPCTDGAQFGNTTCWEFLTPPGEGRGLNFLGAAGFQVRLCGDDQCAGSANFGFQGAVVTQIISSTFSVPTNPRNQTVLTLLGRNFGVVNRGRDAGQSAGALRVSLALPGKAPFAECVGVSRASDGNLTCKLPAGSGSGLDVHVFVQDTDSVTPAALSYDPPVITEVWVMAIVPPAQPAVCVPQTTLDASGTPVTATVCQPAPQQPPAIPDQSTFANANVQAAIAAAGRPGVRPPGCAAGPNGCPLYKITGGQAATVSQLITGGSPLDSGNLVVIAGYNFGPPSPDNCPAMPWSFRPSPSSYPFQCNGNEDFLGEGEVPAGKVLIWTHTLVAFFSNAGIGLKDFEVVAGGQSTPNVKGIEDVKRIRFRYDPPQIFRSPLGVVTGVLPPVFTGDDDVTQPVQLLASNLGPVPIDFNSPGKAMSLLPGTNWFQNPVPLNCSTTDPTAVCAPRMPTSYLVVLVGRVCVARSTTVDGLVQPATANCHGLLKSQTESALTFVPPAGVGRNKQLYIRVVDASAPAPVVDPISEIKGLNSGLSPGQPGWFDYINSEPPPLLRCCGYPYDQVATSGPVPFQYEPPFILGVSPSSVRVGSTASAGGFPNVTVRGYNLGDPSRIDEDMWPAADRALSVLVGPSVPCAGVWRSRVNGPAGFENIITCQVNASQVGVGFQPLSISVGGVSTPAYAHTSNYLDVLVTCESGYFGRTYGANSYSDTCVPCPAQGAYCAGGFAYPRPLPGWYNMNSSDALSPPTPDWFKEDVPRITCPHSAFQGVKRYYSPGNAVDGFSRVTFKNGLYVTAQKILEYCPDGSCYSFNAQVRDSFQVSVPRDVCIVPCPIPGACRGWSAPKPGQLVEKGTDNYCAAGYQSLPPYFSCADCSKGYFKLAQSCRKCPDSPQVLFVGYIVLVIVAAASAWLASRAGLHLAVAALGVDFMQEVAMLAYSKVAWTAENRGLFYVFSAFYLNVEIIAPECTVGGPVSFNAKFFFVMFLPLGFALLLGAVAFATWFVKLAVLKRRSDTRARHVPLLLGACLALWSLLYVYEAEMDMQVFNCAPLSPPTYDVAGRALNFLSVQHEWCGLKGGVWDSLHIFAIVGFVVYVAGFPLGVAYWLYTHRELIMEDQLLRAKGAGEDRFTGPQTYEMRKACE